MRRRLAQEDGIALVVALGFIVVLTILVSSMISYTTSSSQSAGISQHRVAAKALAEAGIAQAASILNMATNASSPTLLGCSASSVNPSNSAAPCTDMWVDGAEGRAYFHGMYAQTGNSGTWTISAYGSVQNPGAANLTKAMTATVSITGGGQTNNISVWNYVYSTAPNGVGCEVDQVGSGAVISVPMFVTGDLCLMADGSAIKENLANGGQKIDIRVLGRLVFGAANATVGTAAAPITSGLVGPPPGGGCTTTVSGNPLPHTCTTADKWFVKTTDQPLAASAPTVDFPGWYNNASPGPKNPCDASTPSPALAATKFDSDTTMNGTTPTFDLTPASSYNCKTSSGELSWNATTKILTIKGAIFFDGNVVSNSTAAIYHGKATIYINGTFVMSAASAALRAGCPASPATPTKACAFANVAKEWDPNLDNLLIVSGKDNSTQAIGLTGQSTNVQAGFMCPSTSTADLTANGLVHEGAFICGKFLWGDSIVLMPLPSITNLPPGAPIPPNAPATISPPVITSS